MTQGREQRIGKCPGMDRPDTVEASARQDRAPDPGIAAPDDGLPSAAPVDDAADDLRAPGAVDLHGCRAERLDGQTRDDGGWGIGQGNDDPIPLANAPGRQMAGEAQHPLGKVAIGQSAGGTHDRG